MASDKFNDNRKHRERLRARFEHGGLSSLADHEIVELLLTLGFPRRDCKPQAHEAIRRFKNLKGVLEAPSEELARIEGLGERSTIALRLIRDVSQRLIRDRTIDTGISYSSAEDVFDYLKISIASRPREVFKVLYLNNRNQLIEEKTLFEGTVNRSAVYPREVMQDALREHASALIFAHNHPSGCLEPSPEDKNLTRTLVFAAIFMQLKVLDHLIITQDGYYSFAEHGLVERWESEYIKLNMPGS
ncbi:MAG: DNA repair protein RadC [Dehalococcoidales bacterium]|nr:DNA repair protein RadC [Dehalococcoidales bacterium]MDD3264421.1 DNA repair protein RadC [Dehalococcoidales bacterium]MDD4321962.1 DNA repair protein RadC [Dehalococcoidales bacterium]MDD4794047.1 DNA repair protein RadC [Dehalococcoidales bacterium]MDD5498207.1 DNA repair protein RadC [Dehalococcoidales bacterium]